MNGPRALEFCRLTPKHEAGLARLFRAIHHEGDDQFFHPHPFTSEEAHRLCHRDGNDLYYVAIIDAEVVGYGMLRGWEEGYEVPSLGIAIAPEARGTGLGKAFMHFLHAASAMRGAPTVRLKVYPQNTTARTMYENLGYRFERTNDEQLVGFFPLQRKQHG